jgi:hypothetical protein
MKHVVKKSMMVAGVLACLFASTAFAQTVTTTPEQDKATQTAALQENKDYDAARGYKNEAAKELKKEAAEKKVEQVKAEKNAAWERDKETQKEAVKENKDYDASHGYKNESVKQLKEEAAEKKAEAAAKKEEQIKAEKNAAWERDKATQAAALKENNDYDVAHGYPTK